MRVFVTGATGFVGGRLTQKLLERGDGVIALVRRDVDLGAARTVRGDLSDRDALRDAMRGCDAVFHVAVRYEVGIPAREGNAMYDVNVRGTENVLDAAADLPRIVHVSTVNVFGNTRGRIVDETYVRPPGGWLSVYDRTKYLAHMEAKTRENVVIAQPGAIYGPGDHSGLGAQLDQARRGTLRFTALADVGVTAVHVDAAADGLLLVHDRGRLGESYVLGGEITRLGEMIDRVSPRPVRLTVPTALLRLAIPAGPLIGRLMGTGRNLGELISASAGVTYWASDAKGRRELGYDPRPFG